MGFKSPIYNNDWVLRVGVNGSEIDARFFEGDGFNFAFSWLIDTLGIYVEIILFYIDNN